MPSRAPDRFIRASTVALIVAVTALVTSCALGERPTIEQTPTAVGTVTGDAAIDAILERLDSVGSAVFTAEYSVLLAFGGTSSAATVTQDGTEPAAIRRSVTIGDVRYITAPQGNSTCSVDAAQCADGIDPARVSDTGVTPDFVFGDMAKRLRRDAVARIATSVTSTREMAGVTATCVDVTVTGGVKQYCVLDSGVLARYVGGDVTIDVTAYQPAVDDSLFVV
jgi:hypothetical protein